MNQPTEAPSHVSVGGMSLFFHRSRRRQPRLLQFQHLEKREVMDASAVLSNAGILTVNAGAEAAEVQVFEVWNRVVVTTKSGSAPTKYSNYAKDQVKQIVFNGSNSPDTFTNRTNINDRIFGRGGNDTLTGGRGRSYIDGGEGNDTIRGGDGNDYLRGGAGNDKIYGDGGFDVIEGGDGNDILMGGAHDDHIYGGRGNDTIYGGTGNDKIWGGAGHDTIFGGAGNDWLSGEDGNDIIHGDDIFGGQGHDTILGGAGHDRLYGGGGNDTIDGGDGNDELYGGNGDDVLRGGSGNDKLYGGWGVDRLTGGPGADYLDGGPMRDTLTDLAANDTVPASLPASLSIDRLYSIKASDGALFSPANEVYFVVAGRQNGQDIQPRRVHPAGGDFWKLNTGESVSNISLWHGDLKPGESADLFVTMFDKDNAFGDVLLQIGKSLAAAVPSVLSGIFSGGVGSIAAGALSGVFQQFMSSSQQFGKDDLLGAFYVRVENVNGRIVTTWKSLASTNAIGLPQSNSAGDTANFRSRVPDGEFSIRASVKET